MKLTALMFVVGAIAVAQPPLGTQMGTPPSPPTDAVKAYVGLTDSQITSLAAIRENEMKGVQAIEQDIATKEKALHDAVDKGTTDPLTVGKQLLDIAALHKKADQAHTDA